MLIDRAWTESQLRGKLERVLSPAVCFRIRALLDAPSADYSTIAAAAMADPYLTSKILALANATHARGQPPVLSLQRALQVLGTRHTHTLLMSIMLAAPFLECPQQETDLELRHWVLALGAAGEWVARRAAAHAPGALGVPCASEPEDCLAAGLMLGLGVLILNAGLGTAYADVLGSPPSILNLRETEDRILGTTHDRVSAWALSAMHAPPELGLWLASETASHPPLEQRAVEMLAALVAGLDPGRADAWLADALPRLGIDPARLFAGDLPAIRARVVDLARVFQVDIDDPVSHAHPHTFLREAGAALESLLTDTLTTSQDMATGLHREAVSAIAVEVAAQGADTDPLTNVKNRRGLDQWRRDLGRYPSAPLGLLTADVDNFKLINDHHGHAAGDRVLVAVAAALRTCSPAPLIVARVGGDEFIAVYLAPTRDALAVVGAALIATVSRHPVIRATPVTISIGGIVRESGALQRDWQSCLSQADVLLYRAKAEGRNRAVVGPDSDACQEQIIPQ